VSHRLFNVFLICILCAGTNVGLAQKGEFSGRPDLSSNARLGEWDLDGNGTWEVGNGSLTLSKAGVPQGPIRRPAALAILKMPQVTKATIEVDVRCTAPSDVLERDLQVVFGYQSPTRFYYVHLSGITNDVHNGVFLVSDANRRRLDARTTPPQLRDQNWHHIRVQRDGDSGRIQIFVDRSPAPAWDLTDKTLRTGRVGVGSFDDTGEFRNLVITGRP